MVVEFTPLAGFDDKNTTTKNVCEEVNADGKKRLAILLCMSTATVSSTAVESTIEAATVTIFLVQGARIK